MQSEVIKVSKLDLTFETNDGPVHALKNVNLTINKGDFVSFIGPSGCGKTTLLRVLADLDEPTDGDVAVNGVSPRQARESRAYGYVFQAAGLYPWRNIAANVKLPLEIMGYSKEEQVKRVQKVLDLVELTGFEKKFPWQLSGGMQQRASIARALSFDADLLLMDEPFGALDEIVRDNLNEQLLELWNYFFYQLIHREPLSYFFYHLIIQYSFQYLKIFFLEKLFYFLFFFVLHSYYFFQYFF